MAATQPLLFIFTHPSDSQRRRGRQIAEGRKHSTNVAYARRRQLNDVYQRRRKDAHNRLLTFKVDLPPSNNAMSLGPSLNAHPDWHMEEKRGLHYYLHVTAPGMIPYAHGPFFNVITPCLATHDIGIREILLAIVAMQSGPSSPSLSYDPALNFEAVTRCNSAVQHFRHCLHHLPREVVQASCILFACIQILQLSIQNARNYIHTAMAFSPGLADDIWGCRSPTSRETQTSSPSPTVTKAFLDQAITSTIVETVALFEFSFPGGIELNAAPSVIELSSDALKGPVNDGFDFCTAIERFYLICQQIAQNITCQSYIDHGTCLAKDLLACLGDFHVYLESIRPTELGAMAEYRYDLLVSAEKMLSIMAHCRILGVHQTDYDRHVDKFQDLIHAVEESLKEISPHSPPFTFLPFVHFTIKPLWWTSVYRRDPTIRRHAIALLKCQRRNEVGLDNWITYNVATTVMKLEEGARNVQTASGIPECERISLRGFEHSGTGTGTGGFQMLYNFPHTAPSNRQIWKQSLHFEEDPAKILPMLDSQAILESLKSLHRIVAQRDIMDAPGGYVTPMLYDSEPVTVQWAMW